jgi:hypothetical protein
MNEVQSRIASFAFRYMLIIQSVTPQKKTKLIKLLLIRNKLDNGEQRTKKKKKRVNLNWILYSYNFTIGIYNQH